MGDLIVREGFSSLTRLLTYVRPVTLVKIFEDIMEEFSLFE